MRVLYVPNEYGIHRQFGPRRAFADLMAARLLEDVKIFSLLHRVRSGVPKHLAVSQLVAVAKNFKPDFVLMQHIGGTGLTLMALEDLKDLTGETFLYHEGDPYSRFLHPLPSEAKLAARVADVVFTVGTGTFADNFRRAGANDVRWSPHTFDPARFGTQGPNLSVDRELDLVMIANRGRPRLRGLPNWRARIEFAEEVSKIKGLKFAIYGKNWNLDQSRGPIPYDAQSKSIRSAWMSINWDHFATESNYFSDRLPISISEGSAHATTFHDGYDDFFGITASPWLLRDKTIGNLIEKIRQYFSDTTIEERLHHGRQAAIFAQENLRQDDQLVALLNCHDSKVSVENAKTAWGSALEALEEL